MLEPAPLEEIEKLEQLRALYHGYEVAMTEVKFWDRHHGRFRKSD